MKGSAIVAAWYNYWREHDRADVPPVDPNNLRPRHADLARRIDIAHRAFLSHLAAQLWNLPGCAIAAKIIDEQSNNPEGGPHA